MMKERKTERKNQFELEFDLIVKIAFRTLHSNVSSFVLCWFVCDVCDVCDVCVTAENYDDDNDDDFDDDDGMYEQHTKYHPKNEPTTTVRPREQFGRDGCVVREDRNV
jgi:hypothetical protein